MARGKAEFAVMKGGVPGIDPNVEDFSDNRRGGVSLLKHAEDTNARAGKVPEPPKTPTLNTSPSSEEEKCISPKVKTKGPDWASIEKEDDHFQMKGIRKF
jgi:hypothetical protein